MTRDECNAMMRLAADISSLEEQVNRQGGRLAAVEADRRLLLAELTEAVPGGGWAGTRHAVGTFPTRNRAARAVLRHLRAGAGKGGA